MACPISVNAVIGPCPTLTRAVIRHRRPFRHLYSVSGAMYK
jgi:hypothetical protein